MHDGHWRGYMMSAKKDGTNPWETQQYVIMPAHDDRLGHVMYPATSLYPATSHG
jgi:hypothetical protein